MPAPAHRRRSEASAASAGDAKPATSNEGASLSGPDPQTTRKRPAWLRALGRDDPPESVTVHGATYRRAEIFKHDSWAATAVYANEKPERIVCKFNRTAPAFGIPLRWVGRVLAAREARFLRKLADVELIPNDLGQVMCGGRVLPHAIARSYIAGETLRAQDKIEPRLFDELRGLLRAVHARDIAYVDLHKLENIVVDTDGHPHLVDFQVAFGLTDAWPGNGALARLLLSTLRDMDDYHVNKHVLRHLRDSLTPEQLRQYAAVPRIVRLHRIVAVPLRTARRKLLVWLRVRGREGTAASELEPEQAYRDARPGRDGGADPRP
jgi:hypothetical protein